MSISSSTRKAGPYNGNGVTVAFPFSFKVFSSADLLVVKTTPADVESTLVLTTDYTVSLNADQDSNPGGTVTAVSAPATGYKITITSQVAELQPVVLTNAGGFYPKVINDALDRLTILTQQLAEKVSRAVKVNISSGTTPDALVNNITAIAGDLPLIESSAASSAINAASASASAVSATASATTAITSAASASESSSAATNSATNASESAVLASNAAGLAAGYIAPVTATSATSTTVGTGSIAMTCEPGKGFVPGHPVKIARTSAATTTFMSGTVTAYNTSTGSLTASIASVTGAGTFSDWTLSIAASNTSPASATAFTPTGTIAATDVQGALVEVAGEACQKSANLSDVANTGTARSNIGAAASGSVVGSGITMATSKVLGRTTASAGAIEEIAIGTGLSLSAGTLACTVAGGVTSVGGNTGAVTNARVAAAVYAVNAYATAGNLYGSEYTRTVPDASTVERINFRIIATGSIRISFNAAVSDTIVVRIYKNGVAAGIQRTVIATNSTFVEDISVVAGETIQLYASSNNTSGVISQIKFGITTYYNLVLPLTIGVR
ncbi:MAG: hypothetical protein WA049_06295 [Ferribacterium limneticum]